MDWPKRTLNMDESLILNVSEGSHTFRGSGDFHACVHWISQWIYDNFIASIWIYPHYLVSHCHALTKCWLMYWKKFDNMNCRDIGVICQEMINCLLNWFQLSWVLETTYWNLVTCRSQAKKSAVYLFLQLWEVIHSFNMSLANAIL